MSCRNSWLFFQEAMAGGTQSCPPDIKRVLCTLLLVFALVLPSQASATDNLRQLQSVEVADSTRQIYAGRRYKSRADSLYALDRERRKAQEKARKAAEELEEKRQRAIDDSLREKHRREEMARKAADKASASADIQAARLNKLYHDSLQAVAKAARQREKDRVDSIKKELKRMRNDLTKQEKDSLRIIGDSVKLIQRDAKRVFTRLDSINDYFRYKQHDSIFREGKRMDMSKWKLNKWTKYFSTIYGRNYRALGNDLRDIMIQFDTVRHDRLAGKLSLKKVPEKEKPFHGRKVMTELRIKIHEKTNQNSLRALKTYVDLRTDIRKRNRLATFYDSLNLANSRRPGERIWNKVKARARQREKRVWKEIDHRMRTYDLSDYDPDKGLYGSVDLKEIFETDSCFNVVRDRLKSNFWRRFSFHTNSVEWLLGVPNIGIEFDLSADPSSHYSLLAHASYKPVMNGYANTLTRINYAISMLKLEARKYWRVGGLQTVDKTRTWDPRDYSEDSPRPDKIRPRLSELYGFYNGLHNDTTMNTEYRSNKLPKDSDSICIWTASWVKRIWQPFRYNKLSGRFQNRPNIKRVYYVGAMVGYDRFHYVLNTDGKQGKEAFACATGGIVFQDLAKFSNGSAFDLDIGIAVGFQATQYSKFDYDKVYNRYVTSAVRGWHITPYPVVKDIHVSLVYTFRPMRNKVHNLFMTEKFRQKLLEVEAANAIYKDKKEVKYINERHLRLRAKSDVVRERKEYGERKEEKLKQKQLEKDERDQRRRNGGLTDAEILEREREDKLWSGEITEEELAPKSEWQLREYVQPQRKQYGTIEYFNPDTDL